jgi:heterodisulfide reductase subunit A
MSEGAGLRIGVYICRCGGNISDVIDVEGVAEEARRLPGVVVARVHTFMCSDPGQQAIQDDIREQHLDRVVVASCSPSLHELTFREAVARGGLNSYLYEHVNIREQGSWAHQHDPEGATAKAVRMIAAAMAKLRHARPLEPVQLPNERRALVIGGGIAGMKAAADLAAQGLPVLLVEKTARLGGALNDFGRVFTSERPARELVRELESQLRDDPRVEVLTEAQVRGVAGSIGNFQVTIEGALGPDRRSAQVEITVGVVIVATGFSPYAPAEGEYGYAHHPAVLTMPQFIRLMDGVSARAKELVFRGRPVRSVAFLHCVGSRQSEGVDPPGPDGRVNEYCSRVCCTTTLQQALQLKQRFPKIEVFDLHRDIRSYGRGHEDYYLEASRAGVLFFRYHGEEPPVAEADGSSLRLRVRDWLTWGEELEVRPDLLVLAVGMEPASIADLIGLLKLPVGDDGFLQEVHPKLRPVEVSVSGVLLAGTAQGPMNIAESLRAASAAASKASALLSRDVVEVNPYVVEVDPARCCGVGACIAECEYGALRLVDGKVEVSPGLCAGCGACVAVCPNRALDLKGWRLDQYEAMVKAIAGE